jgi:hypothetical protein
VDELEPKRHPFQFSLRKLMLWTAAWSAYLGFLRSMEMWLPLAVFLTIYLLVLFAIRIKWSFGRGWLLAVYISVGIAFCCFAAVLLDSGVAGLPVNGVGILGDAFFFSVIGAEMGVLGFLFVHAAVCAVDWADNLMQNKPPQDQ